MNNSDPFYITFIYQNNERIYEKDRELEKYLRKKFKKGIKLEKVEEKDEETKRGIGMELKGKISQIETCVRSVKSRFEFISNIRIQYPRKYD